MAAAFSIPISILLGVLAALYRESVFDRIANVSTLTSISSPEFFLGYILILFLSVQNPWFPSISSVTPTCRSPNGSSSPCCPPSP